MKENLLSATCESELDESIQRNENKFNKISIQLKNLRIIEKGAIILLAIPYTLTFSCILIIFPYLFVFYISEEDASNLFALLLILIYNISFLFGSIISYPPCFGDHFGISFTVNGLFILMFLGTLIMNFFYFNGWQQSENELMSNLWVFLPTIGSFFAGIACFNYSHLHYLYLMNCINNYNRDFVMTLFYKIFSFSLAIGATSCFFFHLGFLIIICILQLISMVLFLFIKKPDIVFKEYLASLYKDYNLKELVSQNPVNDDPNNKNSDIIADNYTLSNNENPEPQTAFFRYTKQEEDAIKMSLIYQRKRHIRKRSSFREIHSHIFKKDNKFLTALSALEALISSYLVLIIPSTIINSGEEKLLDNEKNQIFYDFAICFLIIGISQGSTLFVKNFNFHIENPYYSCNELLKAFSFLIVLYAIAYFFGIYGLVIIGSAFIGYCYFLTVLVLENQVLLDKERLTLNMSSVNMTGCLIKIFIYGIGLLLIDTNPVNCLIIYIIFIFLIWFWINK